jgi:hypothetical protein
MRSGSENIRRARKCIRCRNGLGGQCISSVPSSPDRNLLGQGSSSCVPSTAVCAIVARYQEELYILHRCFSECATPTDLASHLCQPVISHRVSQSAAPLYVITPAIMGISDSNNVPELSARNGSQLLSSTRRCMAPSTSLQATLRSGRNQPSTASDRRSRSSYQLSLTIALSTSSS